MKHLPLKPLAFLVLLTLGATPALAQFSDTQNHWAESYINNLSQRGIVGGFPDGTFQPDRPVTRAQFAALADKVFQAQGQSNRIFSDVPMGHWAYSAIQDASAQGLVTGYPDGTFRPELGVTRAQSLVVLSKGANLPAASLAVLDQYQDKALIPAWAEPAVASATSAQIPVNYPNNSVIAPNRTATRAEVAAFIWRTLNGRATPPVQEASNSLPSYDARVSVVQAGAELITKIQGQETLFIAPNERRGYSLILDRPVRDQGGNVLLPTGSEILGSFVPARGGTRFEAQGVRLQGRIYSLNASSEVIRDTKDPRESALGSVAGDAFLGGAAGAIVAGVTGDRVIATEEVLGGVLLGALAGNVTAPSVVVIDAETPLELVIREDFRLY